MRARRISRRRLALRGDGGRLRSLPAEGPESNAFRQMMLTSENGEIVSHHAIGELGSCDAMFTAMLPRNVCPLLIKSLRSQADFPLTVRLMRTVVLLVRRYRPFIVGEVETLLTLLFKMVYNVPPHGTTSPLWHRALTLEALLIICSHGAIPQYSDEGGPALSNFEKGKCGEGTDGFLLNIFRDYDEKRKSSNVFVRFVVSVSAFVVLVLPRYVVGHENEGYLAAQLLDRHARERRAQGVRGARVLGSTWSASGIGERPTRGLDLLGETEPPKKISLASVLLAGIEILACISDALLPQVGGGLYGSGQVQNVNIPRLWKMAHRRRKMIGTCWKHLLCSLNSSLVRCSDETVIQVLLTKTQTMTNSCGVLGLVDARNSFLNLICDIARVELDSNRALTFKNPTSSASEALQTGSESGSNSLGNVPPKCIQAFKILFNVAHCLGDCLGAGWYVVLNAFERLGCVIARPTHASRGQKTYAGIDCNGTQSYTWRGALSGGAPASECSIVISALQSVFESSSLLPHRPLCHLVSILGNLALSRRRICAPIVSNLAGSRKRVHLDPCLSDYSRCVDVGGIADRSMSSFPDNISNTIGTELNVLRDNVALNGQCGCHKRINCGNTVNLNRLKAAGRKPPFFLKNIVGATLHNMARLDIFWGAVFSHFQFTCSCDRDAYAMRALSSLAATYFTETNTVVAASGLPTHGLLQCELISLFIDGAQLPFNCASLALGSLFSLLQAVGHTFTTGWHLVIRAVRDVANVFVASAAGGVFSETYECWGSCGCTTESLASLPCHRGFDVSPRWKSSFSSPQQIGASVVPQAFKTLRLIVDEFLVLLCESTVPDGVNSRMKSCVSPAGAHPCLSALIDCLRAFGSQSSDVNISLTAVNMVWTVSDYVHREWRASRSTKMLTVFNTTTTNRLWLDMFCQLCVLGCDRRPDLRNCALRTLCSIIAAHGGLMTNEAIALCLTGPLPRGLPFLPCSLVPSLFSLLSNIERVAAIAEAENSIAKREKSGLEVGGIGTMVVHHSRNTVPKQWNETRVLAIQGITRVIRSFFRRLIIQPWFSRAWGRMLQMLRHAILRGVFVGEQERKNVQIRHGAENSFPTGGHVTGTSLEVSVAAIHALGDMVRTSFATAAGGLTRREQNAHATCESAWSSFEHVVAAREASDVDRLSGDNKDGELATAVANAIQHLYDSFPSRGSKQSVGDVHVTTITVARPQGKQRFNPFRVQFHRRPAHLQRARALLDKMIFMRGYARVEYGVVPLERAAMSAIEQFPPFPICTWYDMFQILRGFMNNDGSFCSPALSNKACAVLVRLNIVDTGVAAQRMCSMTNNGCAR